MNQNILPSDDAQIEEVASGQRLVILAILVNLATFAITATVGDIGRLLGIAGIVLAIIGLLRLGSGLGYSTGIKVLLLVLSFIPLVNLIMLVVVNSKATRELKAARYRVGLLGARK